MNVKGDTSVGGCVSGRPRRRAALLVGFALTWIPCFASAPKPAPRDAAQSALMQGRVDEAVAMLQAIMTKDPKDAAAHLLLCRAFYSEKMPDPAVTECETALQGLGSDSEAQDWMGRAYGLKAESAGPIAGYKLAKHVLAAFETAVSLDGKNAAAANDLSEYYVNAPSFVGGGLDNATALADKVQTALPQASHRMRGMIAEERKDYATAEREFAAAVGVAGRADAWVDLGQFYAKRKELDKALDTLHKALAADPARDASVVDVASILIEIHREPELAEKTLREYLDRGAKSDAAPVVRVLVELAKVREAAGDKADARNELQKALTLAKDYEPAKRALKGL